MANVLTADVVVAAPAEATWSVLTDWPRQSEWVLLTRTRGVGPTKGHAVGERVYAFTGVGRVGFCDSMVIQRWDPPRVCGVRKTGRVVRGEAVFRVEPLGADRCRVSYEAVVLMPFGRAGEALWPLVRPVAAAGFRRSLAELGRVVAAEQRHTAPPARA
jgi:hypothetical protein